MEKKKINKVKKDMSQLAILAERVIIELEKDYVNETEICKIEERMESLIMGIQILFSGKNLSYGEFYMNPRK